MSVPPDGERKPSLAVAIPAYNEADGIGGFLREIDASLAPLARELTFVVVDDASTDGTLPLLRSLGPELQGRLEVKTNPVNRGHGPALLAAYDAALALGHDFVLAVDGDGQFQGSDLRRLTVLLQDEAHAVCGVRRFRQDPWFRMIMTRLLRGYVTASFGVRARDPNCPLRGYETGLLADLLAQLPPDCLIPNLYLTIVGCRGGHPLLEVDVSHRTRRGASAEGTSWAGDRRSPIPWRLVRFSLASLAESFRFRRRLREQLTAGASAPGSTASPPPTRAP